MLFGAIPVKHYPPHAQSSHRTFASISPAFTVSPVSISIWPARAGGTGSAFILEVYHKIEAASIFSCKLPPVRPFLQALALPVHPETVRFLGSFQALLPFLFLYNRLYRYHTCFLSQQAYPCKILTISGKTFRRLPDAISSHNSPQEAFVPSWKITSI